MAASKTESPKSMRRSSKISLRRVQVQVQVVLLLLASIVLFGSFETAVARGGLPKLFKGMGQAMRMVKYDRAENERNAVSALQVGTYILRSLVVPRGSTNSRIYHLNPPFLSINTFRYQVIL
jgi:hypothetical protein